MTPRLVVHIGTPKTGSSSLQRALYDGTFATAGVRVAYPNRLSEADLTQAMERGREQEAARRFEYLRRWLATTTADVFVLSCENFVRVPAASFASAMRHHLPDWSARTQVVCYLRPHGPRLVSTFAQVRKSGAFLGSMDDFLRDARRARRLQFADRLAGWQEVYGDRLVTRLMSPAALVDGDVVADFLHLVAPGSPVEAGARRLNTSLTVEALALLGIVHHGLRAAGVPDVVAVRIGKRIGADLNAAGIADRGHRLWLSASEARSVAAVFGDDAARLDATIFPTTRPFTEDIRSLTAEAPADAPDLRPESYADSAVRASIRRDTGALADVCSEHGRAWVAQFRAAKGYRHDPRALRPESAARVDAALEPVVSGLVGALRAVGDR